MICQHSALIKLASSKEDLNSTKSQGTDSSPHSATNLQLRNDKSVELPAHDSDENWINCQDCGTLITNVNLHIVNTNDHNLDWCKSH